MNKLHVLTVPTWFPMGEDKLMGIYHKNFTEALNRSNMAYSNMIYVERMRIKNPLKYLISKKNYILEENNYKVYIRRMLNLNPLGKIVQLKSYTKNFEKAFKQYIKINGLPDVIHAHVTIPAGYAACYVGKKYKVPVVVTDHGVFQKRFWHEPYKYYGNYVLDNCIHTSVSVDLKNKLYPEVNNSIILPNMVNTKIFKNVKNKKKNNIIDLLQVCALREGKGTDTLIKACKIIKEEYKRDVRLTVIGDGFKADYYKKVSKELNMEKTVLFVGQKTMEEQISYMNETDIAVIASEYETFAIPGVEALSAGIPLVTTDCGGPMVYMDEECGKICKINDPVDMAKAIVNLYDNLDKIDRKYLKKVANRYSEEEIVKRTIEVYKKAIQQNE